MKRESKGTRKKAKRKWKRARKECREIREWVQTEGGKSTKRTRNQRGMPENMQGHRTKTEKSTKRKSKAGRKKSRVLDFLLREPGSRRIPNFPDPGSRILGSRPPDPESRIPGSRLLGSRDPERKKFQLARIPNFDNI